MVCSVLLGKALYLPIQFNCFFFLSHFVTFKIIRKDAVCLIKVYGEEEIQPHVFLTVVLD